MTDLHGMQRLKNATKVPCDVVVLQVGIRFVDVDVRSMTRWALLQKANSNQTRYRVCKSAVDI
jgi:hypothetical protein